MNYAVLLKDLEDIALKLEIKVRYEKGNFDGGYCILRDQKTLVVNKKLFDNRKSSILARGLSEFGFQDIEMKPMVRQFIEDEIAKASKGK